MKKAYKLLILLLILATSIGLGITYSEARVCFIVGGCGKDANGRNDKPDMNVQDCASLGYRYLVDGIEVDKSEAGKAKYKGKGDTCTSGSKTYYKEKVCKDKYKYLTNNAENNALIGSLNDNHLKLCGTNSKGGEDSCVDSYQLDKPVYVERDSGDRSDSAVRALRSKSEISGKVSVKKYAQCVCDAKYKYIEKEAKKGFVIDRKATSCVTSGVDRNDGLPRYDAVTCSGVAEASGFWKGTCGTKERALKSETWGDVTCHLCSSATSKCSGYKQYATMGECDRAGSSAANKRYTCTLVLVDGNICYELQSKSCADIIAGDYYGQGGGIYAPGYYGYYGQGHVVPASGPTMYYDTIIDCMSGISDKQTCLSITIGAQDAMTCYYRQSIESNKTCADLGKYESMSECYNVGRSDWIKRYTCKLVNTEGLACYERSQKTCADVAAENADYYGGKGYYDYYYGTGNGGYVQYFETEAECARGLKSGQSCAEKVLWNDTYYGSHDGKTCYYRVGQAVTFTERVGNAFGKLWDGIFGRKGDTVTKRFEGATTRTIDGAALRK